MDGELFQAWVKQGLVPGLQRNDVVIIDNLATHKVAGVREAIEAAGARLEYLPPYSPDLNPIEPMWSKLKQEMRSRDPRNGRQLLKAAGSAFAAKKRLAPSGRRTFICKGLCFARNTRFLSRKKNCIT